MACRVNRIVGLGVCRLPERPLRDTQRAPSALRRYGRAVPACRQSRTNTPLCASSAAAVRSCRLAGLMPKTTTYFYYPKLASGLVFDPLGPRLTARGAARRSAIIAKALSACVPFPGDISKVSHPDATLTAE